MALLVQPLNGLCVFLPHSWRILCGTLPSKCTSLPFGHCILIRDSLTRWITAFGYKDLSEESNAHRVHYPPSHGCQFPVTFSVFNCFDDLMFWAACLLAYFSFLQSAEFTVPSLSVFNPSFHLCLILLLMFVLIRLAFTSALKHPKLTCFGKGATF